MGLWAKKKPAQWPAFSPRGVCLRKRRRACPSFQDRRQRTEPGKRGLEQVQTDEGGEIQPIGVMEDRLPHAEATLNMIMMPANAITMRSMDIGSLQKGWSEPLLGLAV